jgi:hypothetical protein
MADSEQPALTARRLCRHNSPSFESLWARRASVSFTLTMKFCELSNLEQVEGRRKGQSLIRPSAGS